MDLGELNAGLNALDVAFADRDNNGNFVGLREGSERLPVVTAETNPVTGGMGFNGQIVDMDETPDETNTEDYPVGTLFISPAE